MQAEAFAIHELSVCFRSVSLKDMLGRLFDAERGQVWALDGITLQLKPGHALGLVGESGCGKSTLARQLCGLLRQRDAGEIRLGEHSLDHWLEQREADFRSRVQMVFQHPDTFLNPRLLALDMVLEAFELRGKDVSNRLALLQDPEVNRLLDSLGLHPADLLKRSQQLSGGEKKRISILRALLMEPAWIIADEPFAGLDISYRNRVIQEFQLQKERGTGFLFISHDFNVVRQFCDRIAVMYKGRIVDEFPNHPLPAPEELHPYSRALLDSMEHLPRSREKLPASMQRFGFELSHATWRQTGCPYRQRCHLLSADPGLAARCERETPLQRKQNEQHLMRCHAFQNSLEAGL